MKNLTLFFLAMLVVVAVQGQKLGIRGGLQFADFKSEQIQGNESIIGWQLGPVFEIEIPGIVDVQLAALYSREGSRDGVSANKFNLEYLEVPLTLRKSIGPIFIQGGGFASYLINANFGLLDLKDLLKESDYGLHAGLGIKFASFKLDGRYVFGMQNINAINRDSIKNKTIVIGLEYFF